MAVNSNPKIDIPVIASEWEIDPNFALQYYTEYVDDLAKLDSGVPFAELKYSEKRAESRPRLFDVEQGEFSQISLSDVDNIPANSIAVIRINGAMRMEDGFSSQGMRSVAEDIRRIDQNDKIRGMIIDVNSGGGEALAGTMIQNAVSEFSKPVVALAHVAASAAYKAILPADAIIASAQEAQIGSIGTMATFNKRMIRYISENFLDLYASNSTQKNAEFRALQRGDGGPVIQKLDEVNEFFASQVREHRDISGTKEMVAAVFEGKLMNAVQAYEVGLIDGIGTMSAAINMIHQFSGQERQIIPATGINNQNTDKMNFKQFLMRLINPLNSKLGLELEQTSSAEEIIEAVEGAQSVADLSAQLAEINKQVSQHAEQLKQTGDKGEKEEKKEEGEKATDGDDSKQKIETILAELQALRATVEQLTGVNSKLKQELIVAKDAQSDQVGDNVNGKFNSDAPKIKTLEYYNSAFEVPGKSKY